MDQYTDGLKHDGGKPRLSLVPGEAIEAIGIVMTHGAEKYEEGSYRGVDPKRYHDALMRHVCKWLKDPYGFDEDSHLPHLWHLITNAAFLCELEYDKFVATSTTSEDIVRQRHKVDKQPLGKVSRVTEELKGYGINIDV